MALPALLLPAELMLLLSLALFLSLAPPGTCHDHSYGQGYEGSESSYSYGPPGRTLSADFYQQSCPQVEQIVVQERQKLLSLAPELLRLHFHDCAVGGCDSSLLLDDLPGQPSEKKVGPNKSLEGETFEAIADIKKALEEACPATVSCADVVALASKHAVAMVGGPQIPLKLGRLDGVRSFASQVGSLPNPNGGFDNILGIFTSLGLDVVDLVALSGAHSIGKGACRNIKGRLESSDGTMSPEFRAILENECGVKSSFNDSTNVFLDHVTPIRFDNQYFKNLVAKAGLFSSDQMLMVDQRTQAKVLEYASDNNAFLNQFSLSVIKMSEIGIVTPEQGGEVRILCNVTRGATR